MAQFLLGIRNAALCSDTNFDGGAASASLNNSGRGCFGVTLAGDPTAGAIVLFGDGRICDPLNGIDMRDGPFQGGPTQRPRRRSPLYRQVSTFRSVTR
jgi:hypothetical protein